ncbi:MAG: SMC-Scp complex subunit ScpB [Actinobacteria bacterium]|jgi:segregation and condensation protein B|nr:SMC-Scp complex subunit ScpB [Actinomycetota bacterium]
MSSEKDKDLQNKVSCAFDLYDDLLKGKPPLKTCVEGILFIAESPVSPKAIAKVLNADGEVIIEIIEQLKKEYLKSEKGFIVRKIGEGYRLYSNPALSEILKEFVNTNIKVHVTQAALETLAIIAYKQPVTRSQIAEIRGVKTDSVVVNLESKGLVKESGRLKEPGNPIIYRTTGKFLEILGIGSLEDMPPLKSNQ